MTDTPMFVEVSARFPNLPLPSVELDPPAWGLDEPFVDIPDLAFEELISRLVERLPQTTVNAIRAEVWAATELQQASDYEEALDAWEEEMRDGGMDDEPVQDAVGSFAAAAAVVGVDGGGDSGASRSGDDAGASGPAGSGVGAAGEG